MLFLAQVLMAVAPPVINASPDVAVRADISYLADGNPAHTLDLYLPRGEHNPPLLVFVHGGAWISGSKAAYSRVGQFFAGRRIATAVLNYRLSRDPKVRHPDHCRDVAAAIQFLQGHSRDYRYDSGRTFLLGHSAGAHMEGMFATDRGLLGNARIAGFIGLEGIYDIPALQRSFPTYRDWFLAAAFGPDSAWAPASPTLRPVTAKTPWLVIHSKSDELVDQPQSVKWADHLCKSDVPVELVLEDYGKHFDTVSVFDSDASSKEADRILKFIADHR